MSDSEGSQPTQEDEGGTTAGQNVLESPDENTLRVMLSTDNHLGYNERDSVRGLDSFAAFEEMLYLAKRFECDMVLLAGDLFHENKPSRPTLYRTMEILRRYCLGSNPIKVQLLSDPARNFHATKQVNYHDENYSVDLPVFSIHGNHDDPAREGGNLLAALDLLAIANLINYFGRQEEVDKVEVSPILLQKGTTHVALYGLGSLRDERLNRMWRSKKVRFLRPAEDVDDPEDGFFNFLMLHQNRDLGRGTKNCIQESLLPPWMDIVCFGHEHECLIDFAESVVGTFRITQPGSSVATSLVAGEAMRKHVGVLDIRGKNFKMHPVPLTQVRGFVTAEISLRDHKERLDPDDPKIDQKIAKMLAEEVALMKLNARDKVQETLEAARAAGNNAGDDNSPLKCRIENPKEVLVRLRVEHSGFAALNNQRFGAKFVGEIANPTDILLFRRQKESTVSAAAKKRAAAMAQPLAPDDLERTNMEDLVRDFLAVPEQQLRLLPEKDMSDALENFVEKNMGSAIADAAAHQLQRKQRKLHESKGDERVEKGSQVRDAIETEFQEKTGNEQDDSQPATAASKSRKRRADAVGDKENGSGRRIANAGKSSKRKKATTAAASSASDDEDNDDEVGDNDDDDDDVMVLDSSSRAKSSSKASSAAPKKGATLAARRPPRSATSKSYRYNVDSGDDDDDLDASLEGDDMMDDELEDDAPPPKKRAANSSRKAVAVKTNSTRRINESSAAAAKARRAVDDDSSMEEVQQSSTSKGPRRRPPPQREESSDDSDWGTAKTRSQY